MTDPIPLEPRLSEKIEHKINLMPNSMGYIIKLHTEVLDTDKPTPSLFFPSDHKYFGFLFWIIHDHDHWKFDSNCNPAHFFRFEDVEIDLA